MTNFIKLFVLSLWIYNAIYAVEEEKKPADEKGRGATAQWRHPLYFGNDWWDWPLTPQRIFGQDFGLGLFDDMFADMRNTFSRMDRLFDRVRNPYWATPIDERRSGLSEV